MSAFKPTAKAPKVDALITKLTGKDRQRTILAGKCVCCPVAVFIEDFTDQLSMKEYNISGMCQSCQDKVFAGPEVFGGPEE